jgi:hypothetical protein
MYFRNWWFSLSRRPTFRPINLISSPHTLRLLRRIKDTSEDRENIWRLHVLHTCSGSCRITTALADKLFAQWCSTARSIWAQMQVIVRNGSETTPTRILYSDLNFIFVAYLSNSCYMPCRSSSPLCEESSNILWKIHIMKCYEIYPVSYYIFFLRFKFTPRVIFDKLSMYAESFSPRSTLMLEYHPLSAFSVFLFIIFCSCSPCLETVWFYPAQDEHRWRAVVTTVINIPVP